MDNQRQNFYRALALINSLPFPIFILSVIEILNLTFLMKFGFILVLLIIAALKIYVMSAMAGGILEIVSGEEFVFQIRRAHQNAMKFWPGFLAVFVTVRLIDFLLFVLFPALRPWRSVYFGLLETIAAYGLALWMVHQKFIKPLGIPGRKIRFDLIFFMVITLAYCAQMVLTGLLAFVHAGDVHWHNIQAFGLTYIHVFEFIYCAFFIVDHYPEIKEKLGSRQEIFLINPMATEVVQSLGYWIARLYPPVFVVLKALSPKSYQFREFNQVLWHERYYKAHVLVCITCFTSNCYEAYKIAKEFKKRGSTVIMGGTHVTYLPNEALAFCDSVVIGQVEGVWKQVLQDYEKGGLRSHYKGAATEADYHQVHEELLISPPSITKEFLETSRGCKFRCHFCTIPALSGGQIRLQSINDMIDLIKRVKPHYRTITFIDNNIYSDPGYARELFAAIKPLKIKWHSQCTIDIAKNQETLTLARESGCDRLTFGFEVSGASPEKVQGGKLAMARKYIEYANIVKKARIKINGLFIFGFDSDTYSSLVRLWGFCFSIMPRYTALSLLTPLPGSGVYRDMLAQERIINLNWRSYGLIRMVVRHPHMDHKLISSLFPLIQTVFFLTTSVGGLMLLIFCYAIPCWILSMSFR